MRFPVICLEETDSTNNYLKNLLSEGKVEEGTVVCTKLQTLGRGQRGNRWESEKGKNLLASVVLYPEMVRANEQFVLSQIISLAIKDCLDKIVDEITIKWPNDIYRREKKICGILIENTLTGGKICQSVTGFGVNVNQTDFISDVPNPVSLKQITEKNHSVENILSQIIRNLDSYYSDIKNGKTQAIHQKYKSSLFRSEGFHLYNDGIFNFEACIKDIMPDGMLVLETRDGKERKFAFKEVKFIL